MPSKVPIIEGGSTPIQKVLLNTITDLAGLVHTKLFDMA